MKNRDKFGGRNDHLQRLAKEYYQGQAYVHWCMTLEDRKTGWLLPILYYKFREILTHTAFRYGICCPIYCCMPDHFHLLWVGVDADSDQILAARFFRKQMDLVLDKAGCCLQREGYDHVLRDEERQHGALEELVEYIARNPERAGLVRKNAFLDYPYADCLMPGYPELQFSAKDYWVRCWRILAYLGKNGLRCSGLKSEDADSEKA